MLYAIVAFLAVCWIWIIVDLKKTPMHSYELTTEVVLEKTTKAKLQNLTNEENLSDISSIQPFESKKKSEKEDLKVA
ncbi:MAG: hypothetical protein Q8933_07615 [Bacteroidota bacterium]|nr:hypothetical protein [Bacteroidota bacterium]MDP4196392.1 hypothetical protein [Bacteroidota bacterium]